MSRFHELNRSHIPCNSLSPELSATGCFNADQPSSSLPHTFSNPLSQLLLSSSWPAQFASTCGCWTMSQNCSRKPTSFQDACESAFPSLFRLSSSHTQGFTIHRFSSDTLYWISPLSVARYKLRGVKNSLPESRVVLLEQIISSLHSAPYAPAPWPILSPRCIPCLGSTVFASSSRAVDLLVNPTLSAGSASSSVILNSPLPVSHGQHEVSPRYRNGS